MCPRLQDRVILVTGAASGIGRAAVERLVHEGARVAALDIDAAGLRATAERANGGDSSVTTVEVDVGDVPALRRAVASAAQQLGPFDGVFSNAGILPPPVPADAVDLEAWNRVIGVDLTGAVMTLLAALPHTRDGAAFVLTGSSLAIRPRQGRLAYVAAKAGAHAAARALAVELAPRRIRVNVIAPGLTDTPMVHAVPGHVATGLESVPLGDLVPADEVAALAVHLMSDDAAHLTGAVLSIDGGRTAG